MRATTRNFQDWLTYKYPAYEADPNPVRGTYGLVWFLTAKSANDSPRTFAVKSLEPEKLTGPNRDRDLEYLRREFRMWLDLPATYNVVPALGFDVAMLRTGGTDDDVRLPVMRMPRLAGSLEAWVGKDTPGTEERLIALAQAFNGLIYLYQHGIEGHGDLKPSNILYADLRDRGGLRKQGPWPSDDHPWWVRVADLGWADAWVDLGFTNKALRQYLGPERLGSAGRVVPKQSDVFAMGVIASELLQGHHPAPNFKKILKSEGEYMRWAAKGERILDKISSPRLRRMVEKCLAPDPTARPTPESCVHEICAELREAYGHDIEPTLALWRQASTGDAISEAEHFAWAAAQTINLGPAETRRTRENLELRILAIQVRDLGTCEIWTAFAESLILLLEAEGPDSAAKIKQLRNQAKEHLRSTLGPIDRPTLEASPRRDGMPWRTSFERLVSAVSRETTIAGFTYEGIAGEQIGLGALSSCAWAFSAAESARNDKRDSATVERLLAAAIQHAPEEPVPYYFRARWAHDAWFFASMLGAPGERLPDDFDRWLDDLDTACRLAPDWREAREFRESIRPRA